MDEEGGSKRTSTLITHSEWFERFAQGCEKRMVAIVKPDLAITSGVMHVDAVGGNSGKDSSRGRRSGKKPMDLHGCLLCSVLSVHL